jgi:5-carboxyvanillate decarboxylase
MKKIAIEEHFHTKDYVEYLFKRTEFPRREFAEENGKKYIRDWWSPASYRLFDPVQPSPLSDLGESRIKAMNEAGIDMQVLSLSFPGVEMFNAEDGPAVAKDVNDELSNVIKKYPDRFAGFATIAPQSPDAAADELERAVKKLGLKGAMINGHINGEYLDDHKYRVIFERAEKLNVPVYIHPKMPPPGMLKYYSDYPGLASAMLGFTADASLHAMRLILNGVFEKFPGLKIILGHLGESLPFWLWRIDSRFKEEQGDSASAAFYKDFRKTPSQTFRDNFFVSISGMFWQPVLQFVCSVLGADKVMFATDYPYEATKEATEFIESVQIDNADREKICHLNAERILKL